MQYCGLQVKHFDRCHMPCPQHFNPADFFLVIVQAHSV